MRMRGFGCIFLGSRPCRDIAVFVLWSKPLVRHLNVCYMSRAEDNTPYITPTVQTQNKTPPIRDSGWQMGGRGSLNGF